MQICKHCNGELAEGTLLSERGRVVFRDWVANTNHTDISTIPPGHAHGKIHMLVRTYTCPACWRESEFVCRWRLLKPGSRNRMPDGDEVAARMRWGYARPEVAATEVLAGMPEYDGAEIARREAETFASEAEAFFA